MLYSKGLKILSSAAGIALLLICFQNCAKVKIDSADMSGLNGGLNTDTLPEDSTTDVNQPNSPPPGSNTDSGMPADPSPMPAPGPTSPPPSSTSNPPGGPYDYLCNLSGSSSTNIQRALASIRQENGRVREISGLHGKIIVISDETIGTDKLDLLTSSGGKIIICGMEIEEISNTNGNLILVNTVVQRCLKHSGRMQILGNSVCKNVTNSSVKINVDRSP